MQFDDCVVEDASASLSELGDVVVLVEDGPYFVLVVLLPAFELPPTFIRQLLVVRVLRPVVAIKRLGDLRNPLCRVGLDLVQIVVDNVQRSSLDGDALGIVS